MYKKDDNMILNDVEEMIVSCPDKCSNKDLDSHCKECNNFSNFKLKEGEKLGF